MFGKTIESYRDVRDSTELVIKDTESIAIGIAQAYNKFLIKGKNKFNPNYFPFSEH